MNLKKLLLTLAALSGLFIAQNASATCSNYTTYADGQVLTASSLNSLQTNYTNCVNAVLDGDTFTGNMLWHSGSDILMYSDTGSTLKAAIYGDGAASILPLKTPGQLINLNLANATTTNSNDSIKIQCGNAACSATNPGFVTLPSGATQGQLTTFTVTSDVTINLTGAHWGYGAKGDITGAIHRVYAVDHNGALVWCVGYQGGFTYFTTTQDSTTATDIDTPEEVLCNAAITSANNTATEVGYFKSNFDDTGGAAEDLYAVQTSVGSIVTGQTADGQWQPWNPTYGGFSAAPTATHRWMSVGKTVYVVNDVTGAGTSNATSFTLTMPIKVVSSAAPQIIAVARISDNGTTATTPGRVEPSSGVTVNVVKDFASTAWTNANGKFAEFNGSYEAYQP